LSVREDQGGLDEVTQEVQVPATLRARTSIFALHVVKGPRQGEVLTVEGTHALLGRGGDADLRVPDPSLSRVHARFDRDGDTLAVTDVDSRNGTFVEGQRISDRRRLNSGDEITMGNVVVRFSIDDASEIKASRQLYEAAVRDRLTGMHNRGYFDDRLHAEFAFAKRHVTSLAALLIDLDHFKQVNDQYGHPTGDIVLKQTGERIMQTVRAEDVCARYGGEEFVVLARGIDVGGAQVLGQRLRTRINLAEVAIPNGTLRVSASIGVSVLTKDGYRSAAELIAAADEALYTAKRNGRNQVVLHVGSPQPTERVDGSYSLGPNRERVEALRPRKPK
jgi:two-component system cell cycle response regulator